MKCLHHSLRGAVVLPGVAGALVGSNSTAQTRFTSEPSQGPIKTFTLRGIKDSPPYLHDDRCLTLEDTVEFFNLVLETKLAKREKSDLVAFMRAL